MKKVNLAFTKKERKDYYSYPQDEKGPEYPYETTLQLDRDKLESLGFSPETLPKAGTEVTIEAKGYIKRTQVESRDKDEDSMELCIQVTDIGFEETAATKKAKAQAKKLDEV